MVLGAAARVVAVADDAGQRAVAGDGEHALWRGDGDVGGAAGFESGLADPGTGDLHSFAWIEAVRSAEREAAGGGEVFADAEVARGDAIGVGNRDGNEVVAAGERDGERRRARVAVGIGDRVGEDIGGGLAGVQGLHRRVGVVQGIGIAAVGIEHQRAVVAGDAGSADVAAGARRRTGGDAGYRRGVGTEGIAAGTGGDDVARNRVRCGVFGNGVGVGDGQRGGVENVDRQCAGGAVAPQIVDRQRNGVGGSRGSRLVDRAVEGVAVTQGASHRVEDGQRERAGASVDGVRRQVRRAAELGGREGDAADNDAGQTVRRADGDAASGCFAGVATAGETLFIDRGLAGHGTVAVNRDDARDAVGVAVDGDGQCRRAGVAVRIGDRVGVSLGQRLPRLQGIHRRIGVVQGVGVAAVGIELEAAVAKGNRTARGGNRIGRDIGTNVVVVEDVSAQGIGDGVFTDRPAVGLGYRYAVDNEDIQAGAGGSAGAGDGDRDAVGSRRGTGLINRAVERIGIRQSPRGSIVAGQGQGALAGIDGLWRAGQAGELVRCQGRSADGDAGQSARYAHRDGTGNGFAAVGRAEQPALAYGCLPGIDGVDVVGNHGRR